LQEVDLEEKEIASPRRKTNFKKFNNLLSSLRKKEVTKKGCFKYSRAAKKGTISFKSKGRRRDSYRG